MLFILIGCGTAVLSAVESADTAAAATITHRFHCQGGETYSIETGVFADTSTSLEWGLWSVYSEEYRSATGIAGAEVYATTLQVDESGQILLSCQWIDYGGGDEYFAVDELRLVPR